MASLLGGWTLHTMYELMWMWVGVACEPLVYIVYIREMYYFSLVCMFKKAIKIFEANVSVQKGALRFRENFDNRCQFHGIHIFIHCCHTVIVSMTTLFILVRVSVWVPHFINWRLLEHSWAPSSFVLWVVAKLVCSCLFVCLMQSLSYMLWMKNVHWLSHWKLQWIL